MDFQTLSRRELQALCKSKGIRANMSNAAMAEALQSLPSVDRTGEIGSKAPPPPMPMLMSAMKEATIIEEKTHGSLLPRGSRARAKTKMVAAGSTEADVPGLTLQGCQRTAAREAAVAPEPEAAQAIGEEQEHGCPLPRGGRARGKTRKAGARKTEEEVVVSALHTLPGNKRAVAEEAAAPVDAEEVAVGMRTRRSARSKVKIALDQKEEGVQAAARQEQKADSSDAAIASAVVSDKSCGDSEEHAVAIVMEEEATKSQEGHNMTRRAAPCKAHDDLQQDQRMMEEVATAKRRTRRSTRSKVAAAAQKGQKADSSDTTVGPEVDPKDGEVVPKVEATKLQEGKNVTRRSTMYEAQEEVQTGQVTAAPETMASAEAEEVATAKRRGRRRSGRSKVRVATREGQKADSSDTTIGPEVDPKDGEVVPKVEEATKPPGGNKVTRRATVYKTQEEVHTGQVTAASEAMAAVEAEEVATAKRRRRPARSKVRVAARKGQKGDSSDAVNGSTVSNDPKEGQVVEVIQERPTKLNEEDQEQISNARQFASLPKLEDSPFLGVVSKPNAADASDKVAVADEEAIKADFTFTCEADLSNLLVNTLDRFAKPMYLSTDKEEKKGSECWWLLL